jgi:hypothetical protein
MPEARLLEGRREGENDNDFVQNTEKSFPSAVTSI